MLAAGPELLKHLMSLKPVGLFKSPVMGSLRLKEYILMNCFEFYEGSDLVNFVIIFLNLNFILLFHFSIELLATLNKIY